MVILRKAGMMFFAVGVILLLAGRFAYPGLYYLGYIVGSEDQTVNDWVRGTSFTILYGGIVLIIAGAVMFIAGRRKESPSLPAGS